MAPGDDLRRGDRIGRWLIAELIGAGGMGRVYSARNVVLDRQVALKTIDPAIVAKASGIPEQEILDRFRREAQAVAKMRHPNILEIYSYEEVDGRPILEMELLHGETLGKLLRRGPLPVERAVEIILPICAGVQACHDEGMIHRDLKPQNISIEYHRKLKEEVVKVLDFGVSKFAIAADLTQDGRLLGTPTYMAPEQMKGKPADARSDQYAIGVLLYHCLTGRPPYEHQKGTDVLAVLAAVQEGGYPLPRELQPAIPAELETIILRAMNRNPEDRFTSVAALAQALDPFAPARVRDRWRRYFAEANTLTTGPHKLIHSGAVATSGLTVNERGAAQALRTLSEGEIVTAADSRFTSTTAVATPDGGEGPASAGAPPPPPGGGMQETPWALSDSVARTPRLGRRRLVLAGAGAAVVVAAIALWPRSSRVHAPDSVASIQPARTEPASNSSAAVRTPDAGLSDPSNVLAAGDQAAPGMKPDAGGTDVTASKVVEPSRPAGAGTAKTRTASSKPRREKETPRKQPVEILKDGTPNLLP